MLEKRHHSNVKYLNKYKGLTKFTGIISVLSVLVILILLALAIFKLFPSSNQSNENNSVKIILLGPPGSGKGTAAAYLTQKFNIPQISTGDMLRQAIKDGSKIGQQAKAIMDQGGLVSNDIIIKLTEQRLAKPDCANGFLLDGVPRTLEQAEMLKQIGLSINYVIALDVKESIILERITGRRVHQPSGRSYHIKYNPPKVEGRDDITGEVLTQRSDDTKETVLERLKIYNEKSKPLIDYYKNYLSIDGTRPKYIEVDGNVGVDATKNQIFDALDIK